ncbi:hypothetical protein ACLB2K_001203 [Fragaria x ananassa]
MKKNMARVLVVVLAVTVAICFKPCHAYTLDPNSEQLHPQGARRITPRRNVTPEFLETHNKARAAVGVAPFSWSPSLAESAGDIAWSMIRDERGCHSSLLTRGLDRLHDIGSYNLHWDSDRDRNPRILTPGKVVDEWVAMKKYYDYDRNSCVRNSNCSTYTQVVWRKSLELGCAQEGCNDLPWVRYTFVTLCLYSPPGNVPGERPY